MKDDPGRLPFFKWLLLSIGEFFVSIGKFLWELLKTIFKAIANIFIYPVKGSIRFSKAVWRLGRTYYGYLRHGNWKTRLSFVIVGAGCFFNGQVIKGIIFFLLEAAFGLFMGFKGWLYIYNLRNLGSVVSTPTWWEDDGTENGIWHPATTGDNSMLLLLFGVAVVMLTIAYLIFYNMNLKSAYKNQKLIESGKKPTTFRQDMNAFLNEKFHVTVLSFPTLAAFAFTILPLVFMILIAFTNFDRTHQPPGVLFTWVGLTNFMNLFSGVNQYYQLLPDTFWRILQWTLVWAVLTTILCYVFGMILALMINKKGIRFKKMWRTIFVITIAVPQFISLLIIARLLDDSGPIVYQLQQFGTFMKAAGNPVATWIGNWGIFSNEFSFLGKDGNTARTTVIIINLWVGLPYTMLITSGILMNIPADLYESADIDGAGPMAKFFKITLPYMLFVTGPYLVTQFIGNINNFNVIYFLTGGGPSSLSYFQAGQTDLLVTWLYKLTVNNQEYAIGSTLGIFIFLVCSFVSLIMYSRTGAVQKEDEFQ